MQSLCEQVYACMPVLSLKNFCALDPGPFCLEPWSEWWGGEATSYSAAEDLLPLVGILGSERRSCLVRSNRGFQEEG